MASNFLDSTIAQILEDIISQISFEGESHSNIADILLSILNQTPYDEEPKSVIADLFLKLKAKIEDEPFVPDDKEYTSNIAKILVSILNETEYTEEPKSRIAELLLELKEELESFIEVTVSGSVVSFNTKVSKPLVNLTADINPTETGTGAKSPSNPYVIGGHTELNLTQTGVNIWDEQWENGTLNSSGVPIPDSSWIRSKNYSPIIGGNSYYVKGTVRTDIHWYDSEKSFIQRNTGKQNSTVTAPNTARFCKITTNSATYNNDISINSDPTDTAYHAYTGNTYTADFGQTVYGGEFVASEGEYDKVQPTWKSVTPRPTDVFIDTSGGMNGIYFYNVLDRNYNFIEGTCAVADIYTSTPVASGGMRIGAGNAHIYWYGIMDELGFTTREEFRTWLTNNPITIYYKSTVAQDPIILPTKTQVNTLLGSNNLYHDCNGDTTVTYLDKRF